MAQPSWDGRVPYCGWQHFLYGLGRCLSCFPAAATTSLLLEPIGFHHLRISGVLLRSLCSKTVEAILIGGTAPNSGPDPGGPLNYQ